MPASFLILLCFHVEGETGLFRLIGGSFRLGIGGGGGTGGAAGDVGLTALRADGGVQGHGLTDHLAVLPLGLGLLPDHMLHLMPPDGGGRLVRVHAGGGLEGDAHVVGPVLILALLAGLALTLLQGLLRPLDALGRILVHRD